MYDIITVGGATVDVFVRTSSKDVKIANLPEHDVCYPIGAKILVDNLHFDTGGGGTNSAVAFSRLGFKTGWVGKLGEDANSGTIIETIRKEGIDFLGSQDRGLAGYSVILVGVDSDRTILTFKGINDDLETKDFDWNALSTKWFYFSSMLNKSFDSLEKLAKFARKQGINYAFNPSTYLAQQGLRTLRKILDGCTVLVLNKEESQFLTEKIDQKEILKILQDHARIVVITDGANGAVAYNGENFYSILPNKVKVVETTGAGDAFASGVVAGLMQNESLDVALQMGMIEAESVIQFVGAKTKLLSMNELKNVIKKKPAKIFVGAL